MGTMGGSVDEWLACWTQAQKGLVHCASVHQAAKLVAALLRVAGVTAGMAVIEYGLPLPIYAQLRNRESKFHQICCTC